MDTIEAILTRRSVRQYTDKPISDKIVNEILTAAMHAPSAGNQQPWQFIVINKRSILDEIPKFHPFAKMLYHASVAILTCGDESKEKYQGFWVLDCSAATENLLLAAHASGLGAVWLSVFPVEERIKELRQLLGIPKHIIPFALVPLGYPAANLPQIDRYDETRIRYNGW